MKILIHTPISNRAWILPEWWAALRSQNMEIHEVSVLFDLNDSQDETKAMLQSYETPPFKEVIIRHRPWEPLNMQDHSWNKMRYARMRIMRNEALQFARERGGFDFLFSLDSDVILHDPDTLWHLVASGEPIIAGVFMAKWGNPDALALPNVWERGQNEMSDEFLVGVSQYPDHVKVGGLGACTLIRKDVWKAGVNYDEVYNLPSDYRGEDRDFCIRAAVAGFDLIACAHKRIEHRDKPKESEAHHATGRNHQEYEGGQRGGDGRRESNRAVRGLR